MTQVSMTSTGLAPFQAAAMAALQQVAVEHGVALQWAGGKISSDIECILKLQVKLDDPRLAAEQEKKEFDRYAYLFGANEHDYLGRFDWQDVTYELIGFYPDSPKFCCKVRNVANGKVMKFTKGAITMARATAMTSAAA